jgi:hypothetical protein
MQAKDPIEGYVRCETLMPILGVQILPITGMPTRRVLALLTEDGPLTLGVTAESAQDIARLLEKAASAIGLMTLPCPPQARTLRPPRRNHAKTLAAEFAVLHNAAW